MSWLNTPRASVRLWLSAGLAPLAFVAVFVLTSRTTDAFQMAKWSSRNVVPAKVALGIVFAVLGALLVPWRDIWTGGLFR